MPNHPLRAALELGHGLTIRLLEVEPRAADEWLKKNCENNRPVVMSRVRQYAADMKAGRWRLSDQAISFDTEGRLVNGQHRLHACVLAGVPFITLVIHGMPPESILTLDGGKKRTTDDAFKLTGQSWPRGAGATVRRIFLGSRSYAGRAYTDQEVSEFLQEHGTSVAFAHRVLPKGKVATAATRATVARAHIVGKSVRRLEDFGNVLTTGFMVPGDEAGVLLRNCLLEESQSRGGQRANVYLLAQSALKAFLAGQAIRTLKPAKTEQFPLPDEGYWDEELVLDE